MRKFNYTTERAEEIRVALKQDAKEQGKSMLEFFEMECSHEDVENNIKKCVRDTHGSTIEEIAQFIYLTVDLGQILDNEEGLTDSMIQEYVYQLHLNLPYRLTEDVKELLTRKIKAEYGGN